MSNPYLDYYRHQAGTGIAGFQGYRYQRGHGFFGRLISKAVFPVLKFLGKRALSTGADIATDVLVNKKNFKESAKDRLFNEGREIANEGIQQAKKYVLGEGRKAIKRTRLEELIENGGVKKKAKRN